ncbi:MAG: hypothetical protein HKUEN02_21640 [Anaerolineaceae bacterium]|nr:MAG: hypothetical protein HKUEN02_21640 [Anaerolineaceae bacterium]
MPTDEQQCQSPRGRFAGIGGKLDLKNPASGKGTMDAQQRFALVHNIGKIHVFGALP